MDLDLCRHLQAEGHTAGSGRWRAWGVDLTKHWGTLLVTEMYNTTGNASASDQDNNLSVYALVHVCPVHSEMFACFNRMAPH